MKKRRLYPLMLIAPFAAILPAAISCSVTKKSEDQGYLDIKKISRVYLNRLSLGQIASLHNNEKIFYYYDDNDKKQYFDSAAVENNQLMLIKNQNEKVKYNLDFPVKSSWKQILSQFNNFNIIESNEQSNIDDFLNEYTFDQIDTANGFNDEWFSVLAEKNQHDYNQSGEPYFSDIQTIIFRFIRDIDINFSIMNRRFIVNSDRERTLFSSLFQTQYIQAKEWLKQDDQKKLFLELLELYLNKFNVNVKKIIVDWNKAKVRTSYSGATDYVEFEIDDILDWNNNSIMPQGKKAIKYYINNFRNYNTAQKFGVGQKLETKYPLFTDYISNPLLYINGGKYLNVVDNINYFIKGATSIDYWNAKGLMYLFSNFKDEFFYIEVPKDKQKVDKEYQIVDFNFNNYFNTNQLIEATVKVTRWDNSFEYFTWISSNFDDHGHRLKGMIVNNVKPEDVQVSDIFSYKNKIEEAPEGIKLSDFIKVKDTDTAFHILLEKAGEHLEQLFSYWDNDSRRNYEAAKLTTDSFQVKVLAAYFNNYLLAYALENEKGKIHSGVKRIDVNVIPDQSQFGRVYLRLDFMGFASDNDLKFKSENEKKYQSVYLYWNGFKGYSQPLNKLFEVDRIERGK
ncbi:MAG3240 family lipoprotein [Mycoplasma phocoeninasale]|uniref:MAG3240 family lipoprotein n=1 Tax=Mycoplasma phocoeninasale TaxID=2726117 RepID=UPI00196895B8|nr:hypothetical protein [Mycoplasma phocoeninasale]MBN0970760.1 hypothetical protein [Mycoplasma phocoeninasale]